MIVLFDMEGVLVDGEYLPELAKLTGKEDLVNEITMQGIRGEIIWEEGLRRRIELLKGVKYDDAKRVADGLPLMEGAGELISGLKGLGLTVISVSGGFDLVAERVKRELKLDHVFSNEFIFEDGKIASYRLRVNSNKVEALRDLSKGLGRAPEYVAAVVDGANDLDLFELARLRIAYNAQAEVRRRADYILEKGDLLRVLALVETEMGRRS